MDNQALLTAARRASNRAYCPYSHFPVGAAVLTPDGQVFEGCNVENASYGLTICAERVAVFSAVAAGVKKIERIAVSCPKGDPRNPATLMPCGACLQVLSEFASPELLVIIDGVGEFPLNVLLPQAFQLQNQPEICSGPLLSPSPGVSP